MELSNQRLLVREGRGFHSQSRVPVKGYVLRGIASGGLGYGTLEEEFHAKSCV